MGQLSSVAHQANQYLSGDRATTDIDVPQKTLVGFFVVGGNMELVYITYNDLFYFVCFRRQNQAAFILHHLMGTGTEKACKYPILFAGYRILGFVAVAVAGGSGQKRHFIQTFTADAVQCLPYPVGFQTAFLFVVHVPEIAAAAKLGHGTFPVHPVGRLFQKLRDLAGGPGLLGLFNADTALFSHNGIGNEHSAAFDFGNTLTLGSIVNDLGFVNLILY